MSSVLNDKAIISAQVEQNPAFLISKLKEEAVIQFYYGPSSCPPQDFVDGQLDHILLGRIKTEQLSSVNEQKLVREFLANYQLWACNAKLHAQKTFNAVRNVTS